MKRVLVVGKTTRGHDLFKWASKCDQLSLAQAQTTMDASFEISAHMARALEYEDELSIVVLNVDGDMEQFRKFLDTKIEECRAKDMECDLLYMEKP